ncbi:MAG: hypothetical protein NT151_09930 [Acidobacteria bacterium]|nr:hypothetical protein [Acidobacteriota bacterium]
MTESELRQYGAALRERLSIVAGMDVATLSNGVRVVHCPGCHAEESFAPREAAFLCDTRVPGTDFPPFMHNDAGCPVLRKIRSASEAFVATTEVYA